MITTNALWVNFVSTTYPNGLSPNVYRDLKTSYFAGLMCFFLRLDALDERAEKLGPDQDGAEIIECFRQGTLSGGSLMKKDFEGWLAAVYPEGTASFQREMLERTFGAAMSAAFGCVALLAGPSDEPNEKGADRVCKLRDDAFAEVRRLAGVSP